MTLEEALKRNPYNSQQGNKGAYARYLRYNVDGYYSKTSDEVKILWQQAEKGKEWQKKKIEDGQKNLKG